MAIDKISMNAAKNYVRIARGDHTAAYLHQHHMSIPCEDDATLEELVTALEGLPPGLTLTVVRTPGKRPRVRIFW